MIASSSGRTQADIWGSCIERNADRDRDTQHTVLTETTCCTRPRPVLCLPPSARHHAVASAHGLTHDSPHGAIAPAKSAAVAGQPASSGPAAGRSRGGLYHSAARALWHARDGALKIILAVLGAAGYGVRGDARTDHINLRRPLVLVPEAYNA
jgi:hypothetical protein